MVNTPQQVSYYYEDWSCGEVGWDFAEEKSMDTYKIVVPEKRHFIKDVSKDVSKETKSHQAVKSGIVKALYEDLVNAETFVYQIQNTDYSHYLSEASLSEAMSLTFIGLISYLYKNGVKNELSIIRKQKMKGSYKSITLQEINNYLKFQKFVKTVMITFLFIFTKNIKNAE
jgi:hypothetical protein